MVRKLLLVLLFLNIYLNCIVVLVNNFLVVFLFLYYCLRVKVIGGSILLVEFRILGVYVNFSGMERRIIFFF